jgi:single-stranded DNA-binding protein
MSGVNQITIVGNVGSAPELSYGQSSVPFCRFSVAVNEQWKTAKSGNGSHGFQ